MSTLQMGTQITPFTISVDQAVLDDLRRRLAETRWPDEGEGAGWSMGTDLSYMKRLTQHWQRKYDWRAHEAQLNKLPQFTADVDGTTLHFIHQRGQGPNPTPLLLLHGWPDSFYRYHKVVPLLADPARYGGDAESAFDVVVPSIPGFGFSERTPMPNDLVGDLLVKLMTALGYERFVAGGGDLGSMIALSIARRHSASLLGLHLTDVGYPDQRTDFASLSAAEREFAGFIQTWWFSEGAFNMVQATKPQSLAFGLNDSPVGMAAWMMSFIASGNADRLDERFSMDELLTNCTIYWVSETIGSSMRIYLENARAAYGEQGQAPPERSDVPAAVAHMPWDAPLPRAWAERQVNLQQFSEMPTGGHFTAWEAPEPYASDLRAFLTKLRTA